MTNTCTRTRSITLPVSQTQAITLQLFILMPITNFHCFGQCLTQLFLEPRNTLCLYLYTKYSEAKMEGFTMSSRWISIAMTCTTVYLVQTIIDFTIRYTCNIYTT